MVWYPSTVRTFPFQYVIMSQVLGSLWAVFIEYLCMWTEIYRNILFVVRNFASAVSFFPQKRYHEYDIIASVNSFGGVFSPVPDQSGGVDLVRTHHQLGRCLPLWIIGLVPDGEPNVRVFQFVRQHLRFFVKIKRGDRDIYITVRNWPKSLMSPIGF